MDSIAIRKLRNGLLLMEIGYTKKESILSWLLGFGDKVKVLEPDDIKKEIKRIAKNILAGYE